MIVRRRRVPWLVRIVVPIVLLLFATPWAAARNVTPQAPPDTALAFSLYLATESPPTGGYAAIDPRTLADLPDAAPLTAGDGAGWALVSGDGSTGATVVTNYSNNGEIVTWDLRTGRARTRLTFGISSAATLFATAAPVALSRDGTRLLAEVWATNTAAVPHTWTVVDTATGEVVLTMPEEAAGPQVVVDEVAWRMYRFYYPGAQSASARLVAAALTTGAALGEVAVPDLPTGLWPANPGDQEMGGEAAPDIFSPGLALAPDGQELAIVHADWDAVTLLATDPLRVERTVAFGPRASLWDRVAALLPLWPQPAAAKGTDGTWRRAVFAADGWHLYVYGDRFTLDSEQEHLVWHGLGLAVVDLAIGTATEPVLTDERIDRVLPAPDGQGIYVASYPPNGYSPPATVHLRRLDTATLRPLAERTLNAYGELVLIPAVPNTWWQ